MKKNLLLVVLLCLYPLSSSYAWNGYVTKVLDGDSFRIKKGRKTVEVRLYGIDSPEWGQAYGNRAKRYLKAKINRTTVRVSPRDVDRYGRTVALVSISGRLMNRELVREGLAWMYPRYCKEQPLCSELKKIQRKAMAGGHGLWRDKVPVPPWQWRQKHKKKRH
jgi:endonuclease YncB( thermonuclease family)